MDSLLSFITKAPSQRPRYDDDSIDRLHNRVTPIVLGVFALVVVIQQDTIFKPITCWVPAEFHSSHVKYTNNFCWVKNSYFLPFEEEVPKEHEVEKRREILYYQWTPIIFLTMAMFFYLPSVVWNSFNSKAGVDSDNILETAGKFQSSDNQEEKDKLLRLITNQFERFLANPRTIAGSPQLSENLKMTGICGKRLGNYLILLFIFTKFLYIGNCFAQLFILNSVLKTESNIFGVDLIKQMTADYAFLNNTIFPKVTFCDFHVRKLGNVQRYTVQCLLPVNLYTEKMFAFMWFWMSFLLLLTFLSLIVWAFKAFMLTDRYSFIEDNLYGAGKLDPKIKAQRERCLKFVTDYLRPDGIFVLRLIGHNTNSITTSEIIASVYESWLMYYYPKTRGQGLMVEPTGAEDENENAMPMRALNPPYPTEKPRFDSGGAATAEKPRLYPKPNVPPPPPAYTKPQYHS